MTTITDPIAFLEGYVGDNEHARRALAMLRERFARSESGRTEPRDRTACGEAEYRLLKAVLDQARETLLVFLRGSPEAQTKSLGKLNLACKAHWDWETARRIEFFDQ